MRIFVAGGTGAIGRPLVTRLVAAGHEVTVFSRSEGRVTALGLPNVVPAVGDAFDPDRVVRAVQAAKPEVVINQLTNLPQSTNPLAIKRGFDRTCRLRAEVSGTLMAAARSAARAASWRRASRSPTGPVPACAPSPTRCGPTPAARSANWSVRWRRSSRPRSVIPASKASCCATAPSTGRAPTSRATACTPPC